MNKRQLAFRILSALLWVLAGFVAFLSSNSGSRGYFYPLGFALLAIGALVIGW